MGKFAKWIGGGLGLWVGGPLGALFGFLIGSVFDNAEDLYDKKSPTPTTGDFALSLLVLVAAVMKADGKVMKSELDYVKAYFQRIFDTETAVESIKMLRDLLKQNIPVKDVSMQIGSRLDHASRLQLLHFLYGISGADGTYHPKELETIEFIAMHMGISSSERMSIHSMFVPDTDSAYKILEINRSATDEEVKKAYRNMALKYHPDKVSYLGDDFKKAAEEKFTKVQEAYEKIKKERGIH